MDKAAVATLKKALRAEYEKDMEAIERVERLLLEREAGGPPVRPFVIETPQDAPTLIAAVEEAFRKTPAVALKVSDIVSLLRAEQFPFETEDPKKTVHSAIWKLTKKGVLRTLVRGKGRQPSTYQLVPESHGTLNGTQ